MIPVWYVAPIAFFGCAFGFGLCFFLCWSWMR